MDKVVEEANKRLLERRKEMGIGEKSTGPEECEESTKPDDIPCEKHPQAMRSYHRSFFYGKNILGPDEDEWLLGMCPVCESEWKAKEEENERFKVEREEREFFKRRLENCQLGQRFQNVTFDQFQNVNEKARKVKEFCQQWATNFKDHLKTGASIIMVGRCGTGKNTLSAAICTEVIRQGNTALHTTAMKLVRRIKDTWRDREQSEQEAINEFSRPALLVIDEVGVQFGSPTEQLFLTEVINERYEAMKPTILLSNLPLSELENLLGVRVIDRFHEGESRVLVFDWESYRRRRDK